VNVPDGATGVGVGEGLGVAEGEIDGLVAASGVGGTTATGVSWCGATL
jgi:hypothetical protein